MLARLLPIQSFLTNVESNEVQSTTALPWDVWSIPGLPIVQCSLFGFPRFRHWILPNVALSR